MARKKRKVSRKQGLVSWFVNVITAVITFSNIASRAGEAVGQSDPWRSFSNAMIKDHTGYDMESGVWGAQNLIRGWGPIIGGVAFKQLAGEASRRIKIKSLIPALRA